MSKTISTKINAIFLAIVLIAGTIATISLSFLTNIQAQPYNRLDNNNYKKSYGKDNTFDDSEKEQPLVYDENPQITQLKQKSFEKYKKLVEKKIVEKKIAIVP